MPLQVAAGVRAGAKVLDTRFGDGSRGMQVQPAVKVSGAGEYRTMRRRALQHVLPQRFDSHSRRHGSIGPSRPRN